MEVHAHTHTARKKWTHYLWEFLMLFLAVFCGFLAEYKLEHIIEHNREKEYLRSFIRDLKNDTLAVNKALSDKRSEIATADSVFSILESDEYQRRLNDFYYLGRILSFRDLFKPNDGTLQQLKNAGGLRLIRNAAVTDRIQDYSNLLQSIAELQQLEESQIADYRHSMSRVFNALVFNSMYTSKDSVLLKKPETNPPLLSADKFDINNLMMKLVVMKGNRLGQLNHLNILKVMAQETIELIKKEYHLK